MVLMVPGVISAWFRHTPRNGKPLFSMDLALNIFLAPLGQQFGITVEETLKTQSYLCHPLLTFVSQVKAFEFSWEELGL